MKPEVERALDELDTAIHESMVEAAYKFMDMGITDFGGVIDSTGGVVTVLQARHMHAIVAFLGAMLDSNIPMSSIRSQAGAFKDSVSEMIDDAVTQAVCQHALQETVEGKAQ